MIFLCLGLEFHGGSLGTFRESLGKVWEILSECLWNPGGISWNLWGVSGESLGNPFGMLMESGGISKNLWGISGESLGNPFRMLMGSRGNL